MLWLADRAVQLVVDCLVNVDVVLTIHCPSSEEDHVVSAQAGVRSSCQVADSTSTTAERVGRAVRGRGNTWSMSYCRIP